MLGVNHFSGPAVNGLATKGRKIAVDAVSQLTTGAADGTFLVKPYHSVILATANTTMGDITVQLPAVAEAEGQFLTVRATIANSKSVTLVDSDDSSGWSDLTLDADGDMVLLYCDGIYWHVVVNSIS